MQTQPNPAGSESIAARLARVEERIANACVRAHRGRASVRLLAVTKLFPAEAIRRAWELGLREFGENYVQEFERKAPLVTDLGGARFHLIGHLQSNKTRKAAQLFQAIDSVDSARLARRLSADWNAAQVPLDVSIEVKLSNEEAKTGAAPAEVPEIIDTIRSLPRLHLRGLMTVPPWSEDPEQSRPWFAKLRELAERHSIPELSMGMSNDLEIAIEEGATWVRVGTAIFGPRPKA